MPIELSPLKVFYSYSQSDRKLQEKLEKHLVIFKRKQIITEWHNRNIQAGQEWKHEISAHLNAADIILLLISPDFLASDYLYSTEMSQALKRHQQKEAYVIPILLRPIYYEEMLIENLPILPSNKRPISEWRSRDAAFFEIAKSIEAIIRKIQKEHLASFADKERPVISANSQNQSFLDEKTEQAKYKERLESLPYKTINTHFAVTLFQQVMQPKSATRVLRLIGDNDMGKSHLLTKVFRTLAEKYFQAQCIILDLRNKLYGVPETLEMACNSIGIQHCNHFDNAYQNWLLSPRYTRMKARRVPSFFQAVKKEPLFDPSNGDLVLTSCFLRDLMFLNDKPLLILIDSVEQASERLQQWITDVFLVQVSCLEHVRIVIASNSLPDPHGSYAHLSSTYQLKAVEEVEEYITYCKQMDIFLDKQTIHAFAHSVNYIPGKFTKLVDHKFINWRPIIDG